MHLFVSAGEPSGDLHASNLVRAVRDRRPDVRVCGFGGPKLAAAGADLLYPLTDLAVMWFGRVALKLPTFFRLADQAERYFKRQRPDAVVLIDYPGFHWHIAKRAKAAGVPVYYFVPPQLWAWGGWRVRKMRKTVDTVLTALPFEDDWYRRRGVNTQYVGHPYFDDLGSQQVDAGFVLNQRGQGRPVVALLPGSRGQEVTGNFPMMLAAAEKIAAARPDARFLVASFNEKQAAVARSLLAKRRIDAEIHVGRTPEIIETADACIAVSGSVGLEMLYRRKPTVVVYRIAPHARFVARRFITCRYISLVNLLADEEIFPEFLSIRDDSTPVAGHVLRWLNDPAARTERVAKLDALRAKAAVPGACGRVAEFLESKIGTASRAA